MKKIGLLVKEISGNRIKEKLKESQSVFIIGYSGLSGPDLSVLRQGLTAQKARLFVVKNSVARRSLKDAGLDELSKRIDGPSAFIFINEEPIGVSRLLCDFSKTHEQLKLEAGFLKDRILEKKDIEALAKLPSKDALRALVVSALNSPLSGLVIVLNQTLRKFVYCIDQIKQKKSIVHGP